jgi:hypothetical protein
MISETSVQNLLTTFKMSTNKITELAATTISSHGPSELGVLRWSDFSKRSSAPSCAFSRQTNYKTFGNQQIDWRRGISSTVQRRPCYHLSSPQAPGAHRSRQLLRCLTVGLGSNSATLKHLTLSKFTLASTEHNVEEGNCDLVRMKQFVLWLHDNLDLEMTSFEYSLSANSIAPVRRGLECTLNVYSSERRLDGGWTEPVIPRRDQVGKWVCHRAKCPFSDHQ